MPKTYLELGGYDKGQAILRFKDMPEAYTCYNTTPGGSATAVLTPVGRCKFADPDDADSAVAGAISDAFSDIGSKGGTWCVGEVCFTASGFGTATVGDYSASARISAGLAYQQGDPLCDPAGTSPPSGGGGGGFEFTVTGPGRTGVNLRPILESVNLAGDGRIPSIAVDAFNKWREDCFTEFCMWSTPIYDEGLLDGWGVYETFLPTGYPSSYDWDGRINIQNYPTLSPGAVRFALQVPAYVPGVGNTEPITVAVYWNWVSGNLAPGSTVVGSGFTPVFVTPPPSYPQVTWGPFATDYIYDATIIPSGTAITNVSPAGTVTLTGNPVVESTGVWQWGYTEISTAGGGSDFEGTGTWGLNPVMEFPVVWNDPDCLVNLYYTNRRRLLIRPDIRCMNEFQLMFTPDTTWPKGFTPACRVWVSVPPIPAGA